MGVSSSRFRARSVRVPASANTAPQMESEVQIRAAYDIGSGLTKCEVAEVDVVAGKRLRVLYSKDCKCMLREAMARSGGTSIGEDGLDACANILRDFKSEADSVGATAHSAIATAVFREAADGDAFLQTVVGQDLGIPVQVVSQDLEGQIGFLTALASSQALGMDLTAETAICWDSGGGSFQITSQDAGNRLGVWCGPLGSASTTAAMISDVQGRSIEEVRSPNPCTIDDCKALADLIRQRLGAAPVWLARKLSIDNDVVVVGIGGNACAFGNCAHACASNTWDAQTLWLRIEELAGLSDEQVEAAGYPTARMILPKLVLVHTVMTLAGIQSVTYAPSNGGCAGMHLMSELW